MVTVDGFFAGPKGEIDWHNTDDEFNEFVTEQLREVGTILFGRVTYEMMASYWPSSDAPKQNPKEVVDFMDNLPKIVFSRTIKKSDWNNTIVKESVNAEEILKMKEAAKKDIFIFGSGQIVQQFTRLELVDEYRLMINPIVLGSGKPLFKDVEKFNLNLLKTREFKNGNILLYYTSKK
jgi:dihydrofolate reductase